MALFGRRKKKDLFEEDLLSLDGEGTDAPRPEPAEGEPGVDRDWVRAEDGPYDHGEWPELDGRLDLGALRVPIARGMQIRLDLEQGTGRPIGVTLTFGASHAQLQAFAAPRSFGLWDELRPEIARGLVDTGGAAEVVQGAMGKELKARMPGRAPDGRVSFQPARFIGVDGPRWFLRVVVNGPAAGDEKQLRAILSVLRRTVVVRGDEPRPPREVLTLTPPKGFEEAMAKEAQARQARLQREREAEVARVAAKTQVLRTGDATGVAGVGVGQGAGQGAAQVAQGGQAAPADQTADPASAPQGQQEQSPVRDLPTPEPELTDAPKAPTNPDFQ
ncbi:DUF3710 domain-containing protein [Ornithinimicrobium pratense]|uniref:DUF3710 domain-containing protein n=1 Tax=Ornithinimicrobium pratense TaxID=2593973 RepID=UPI0017885911|nr:DUF3710 domain-containing protein [Ornithinimicrobium pratense]